MIFFECTDLYNNDFPSDIVLWDAKCNEKNINLYVSLGGARHKVSYL